MSLISTLPARVLVASVVTMSVAASCSGHSLHVARGRRSRDERWEAACAPSQGIGEISRKSVSKEEETDDDPSLTLEDMMARRHSFRLEMPPLEESLVPSETDSTDAEEGEPPEEVARGDADDDPAAEPQVVRIDLRGLRAIPEALVRSQIETAAGSPLQSDRLAADVRRLWALETFEDIRVRTTPSGAGVALVFEFDETPLIGSVFFSGIASDDVDMTRLELLAGGVYRPARLWRELERLRRRHQSMGYTHARGALRSRRRSQDLVDVCFVIEPGTRYRIEALRFVGNESVSDEELLGALKTHHGRINAPGGAYREDMLEADLMAILELLRNRGLLTPAIGMPIVRPDEERGTLIVDVPIDEGPLYRVGRIEIEGDLCMDRDQYDHAIALRTGDVFVPHRLRQSLDLLATFHSLRCNETPVVTPITDTHSEGGTIDVRFEVTTEGGGDSR